MIPVRFEKEESLVSSVDEVILVMSMVLADMSMLFLVSMMSMCVVRFAT